MAQVTGIGNMQVMIDTQGLPNPTLVTNGPAFMVSATALCNRDGSESGFTGLAPNAPVAVANTSIDIGTYTEARINLLTSTRSSCSSTDVAPTQTVPYYVCARWTDDLSYVPISRFLVSPLSSAPSATTPSGALPNTEFALSVRGPLSDCAEFSVQLQSANTPCDGTDMVNLSRVSDSAIDAATGFQNRDSATGLYTR